MNSLLSAQEMNKKNLIQLKYKVHYFKESQIEFIQNLPSPNIAYTRFLKNKHYFIGGEIDKTSIYYDGLFIGKNKGFVVQRNFLNIELKGGYQLFFTTKKSLLSKFGLLFRTGYESQLLYFVTTWNEIITKSYSYNNIGFEASAEYLYHLNKRWSLCLGSGFQYFLSRSTTKHHLRMNLAVGFAF